MFDIKPIVEVKKPASDWWKYVLFGLLVIGLGVLAYFLIKRIQKNKKEEFLGYASPIEKALAYSDGLEKWLLSNGYKIPQELSIIGFADGVWSRRMTPSMSTVSQHGPEIGEVAAQLLIEKLESNDETYTYTTTVINTELRQRDSTKKI
jgi:hypothetical protein